MTLSVAARRPILFRCASPRTPSAACCPQGCEFRRSGIFQVVKMAGNDWPDWLCFSPQIKTSPQVWGRGWRQRQHRVGLEPSGGKRTRWPGEINARLERSTCHVEGRLFGLAEVCSVWHIQGLGRNCETIFDFHHNQLIIAPSKNLKWEVFLAAVVIWAMVDHLLGNVDPQYLARVTKLA